MYQINRLCKKKTKRACASQAAMEYLIALAVVTVIILVAFKNLMPEIRRASNAYFDEMAEEIMGAPPAFCPIFDLECTARPHQRNPLSCPPPGESEKSFEFGRWQTADCCSSGDDNPPPRVTICCNKDMHLSSVQSAPTRCSFFCGQVNPPSCPVGQQEFVSYTEGDGSCDDVHVTLCVDENSFPDELKCTDGSNPQCSGYSYEDWWGSSPDAFPDCPLGGFKLVEWCTGDCTGDDAKVIICCSE